MKRTSVKLKLKRRLEFVRATVRQLTPSDLENVNGGDADIPAASILICPTKCCDGYTGNSGL